MAFKICLDAGHYGNWNCNKNVSPTYWESRMAWKLHLFQKQELEKYKDVIVITTRTDVEKDLDVTSRGKKAAGCDLLISDHSNSCEDPSVDRPVVIYPVSEKCKDLANKLGLAIRNTMNTKDPHRTYLRWNSANNADWYGVIRGAAAVGVPALILEHSFHSNNAAAAWLSKDENLKKLAKAEVEVIAAYYNLKKKTDEQMQFIDVKSDAYYHEAVKWAFENGITAGLDATHFGPDEPCTRAQIVTFLYKYHKTFHT